MTDNLVNKSGDLVNDLVNDCISRQAAIKTAHLPVIDDASYEVVRVDDILALPPAQPSVSKEEMVGDAVSRQGVLRLLNAVPSEEFATKAMLISGVNALPSEQSELEDKIRAIGYTGKEGRINIHGRMFAVRELPQ